MSEIKKWYATEDTLREVADLLYGGGLEVRKAHGLDPDKPPSKAAYNAAMAGNTLATVGGAHAMYSSVKHLKNAGKPLATGRHMAEAAPSKIPGVARAGKFVEQHPKASLGVATGWVGLHGAELLSDVQGRRAMKSQYKQSLKKSEPSSSDLHVPTVGKLKKIAGKQTAKAIHESPHINATKVEVGRRAENVKNAALGKSFSWECEISKVDVDKRQVFGWASITELDGEPVYDLQGDYIEAEEIEKSAYDYVIKSRKGGNNHARNADDTPVHSSDMIESFMVTPEKVAKMGLPEGSLPTGWWVGYQVNDDEAWNLVKTGQRTAFSIHGRGNRTPMED